MNINQKIWLGFGILIGMVLVGSSIGYVKSQKADDETHQFAEVNLAERDAAQNAQNALKNAAIQQQIFIYTKDSNAISRFEAAVTDVKAQLNQVAKVSPDVTRRNNATQTLGTADAYLASFQKLVALKIRRGLTQNDGLEGELRSAVHQVEAKAQAQGLAELSVTMLMARRHEKDYLLRGDPAYVTQIQDCITNFCKQMKELSLNDDLQKEMLGLWTKYLTAMQALVAGEQQIKVVQGEFETQSQAINNQLAAIVSAASADLKICNTGVLNDLSLGKQANFYGIVVGSVVGLLIACWVAASLRSLTRTIFNSASVISGGANQIVSASGQVSTSSQSLAEGSSEQAASVEETGASLEELSSMTKRNAENAQKAKDLAREARSAADMGAGDMQAMNTAMQAIKTSSDDIAKIIKTIDEIAFQTNILALNAAVEAARAGEAGMGFAVVADEVRSLAQRSATAAKETAAKIEGAINNTTQGVQLSTKVTEVLQGIMAKVRQVDELVAEVAGASSEQTQGITQINSAVAQMDKVTQSNAANAEESAAAAEELNSQAAVLNQAVEDLLQLVGGAASRPQPRAAAAPRPMIQSAPQRPALQHGHRQGQPSAKPAALTAARRTDIPMAGDFQNF